MDMDGCAVSSYRQNDTGLGVSVYLGIARDICVAMKDGSVRGMIGETELYCIVKIAEEPEDFEPVTIGG